MYSTVLKSMHVWPKDLYVDTSLLFAEALFRMNLLDELRKCAKIDPFIELWHLRQSVERVAQGLHSKLILQC